SGTGDVGMARGVDGNATRVLLLIAAKVGRIDQSARSIYLGHEHLSAGAVIYRLIRLDSRRKIRRVGIPGYVGIAARIDGNTSTKFRAEASEEAGENKAITGRIQLRHESVG